MFIVVSLLHLIMQPHYKMDVDALDKPVKIGNVSISKTACQSVLNRFMPSVAEGKKVLETLFLKLVHADQSIFICLLQIYGKKVFIYGAMSSVDSWIR